MQNTANSTRYTHYTLRYEQGWEVTYLRETSDESAVNAVKSRANLSPGDVWRPTPEEWDCGMCYISDGTVYLFRIGEDDHFFAE